METLMEKYMEALKQPRAKEFVVYDPRARQYLFDSATETAPAVWTPHMDLATRFDFDTLGKLIHIWPYIKGCDFRYVGM
jgi:hypothetical protein